jgi:hypothetical protein
MQEIYNKDTDKVENTLFLDMNGNLLNFQKLIHEPINEKIYYSPSCFPFLSNNSADGCLYKNYTIPNNHYDFTNNISELPQDLTLSKYIDIYYNLLKNHIQDILKHYEKIIISFSGGIDSLVLLSFVELIGALDKILLVNYENYFVDQHPDLIRNNTYKFDVLKEIQSYIKDNFIRFNITDYDWVRCVNYENFTELKLYGLATIMHKFPNYTVIGGHQGDKTLLHDTLWFDQLMLHDENNKKIFDILIQNKKLYMNNFLKYDTTKKFIPLKNYNLRSNHAVSEIRGKFYNPLGIDTRICRRIDISTVSLEDIMDARVAREIIYRNVGKKYNGFITQQGNFDGDTYSKKSFKKSNLNPNIFVIPDNINHNQNGMNWLTNLIKEDEIETNTLTSLKMIQFLSKIYCKFN